VAETGAVSRSGGSIILEDKVGVRCVRALRILEWDFSDCSWCCGRGIRIANKDPSAGWEGLGYVWIGIAVEVGKYTTIVFYFVRLN